MNRVSPFFKSLLPNRDVPVKILRGPFKGAVVVMNPRNSMRKVLGLYEHELNAWLAHALSRVTRVLDVGANDGYFTFGVASAFHRLGKAGEIIAYEPQQHHIATLRESMAQQYIGATTITLSQTLVGGKADSNTSILDDVRWRVGPPKSRENTLIKIDVEGAELEVLSGASSWLNSSNCFVIEVHDRSFLEKIKSMFALRGLRLMQIDQRPLPLLGRDNRAEDNWWLVSDLND